MKYFIALILLFTTTNCGFQASHKFNTGECISRAVLSGPVWVILNVGWDYYSVRERDDGMKSALIEIPYIDALFNKVDCYATK